MEMIKGYIDDHRYRKLLCDMTQSIFGFSFESWYQAGYFLGEYIPYSYIENGKILANASANIMKFLCSGTQQTYIQIGTVMTRPEYRNRGFARELILEILKDYENCVDGFYLFGNINAVGFYKKLGFRRLDQWRWFWSNPAGRNRELAAFRPVGIDGREAYVHMLKRAVGYASFDHINRCSLQMFHTMNMEDVYFCEELNCYTVMRFESDTLYLDSVISECEVSIREVVARIDGDYSKIIFGFTPTDRLDFTPERFDGAEDYRFFYLGEKLKAIEEDQLYFPLMSHA